MRANEYIFFVLIIIVLVVANVFSAVKAVNYHAELVKTQTALTKEKRYSWEMIKGCEGHRMYLMNILDEHKIEYFN
jgi:hypothetical protein